MTEIIIHLIWAIVALVALFALIKYARGMEREALEAEIGDLRKLLDGLRVAQNENMQAIVQSNSALDDRLRVVENAL